MDIVKVLSIPTPPSSDLGFYEYTEPECILTSPTDSQLADIPLGVYDGIEWFPETPPVELEDSVSWGTKTLPGAGPFYFSNREDGYPIMGHIDIPEQPYEPTHADDYTYEVVGGEIMLTFYHGSDTRFRVPRDDGNGNIIIGIADSCFMGKFNLEAVKLPDTIRIIE